MFGISIILVILVLLPLVMALTIANPVHRVIGSQKCIQLDVTFDNSYPTGGEPLDYTAYLTVLDRVEFVHTTGYICEYDSANKKIIVYWIDNDAGADSAMIEVANTTDLSGLAVKALLYGN